MCTLATLPLHHLGGDSAHLLIVRVSNEFPSFLWEEGGGGGLGGRPR